MNVHAMALVASIILGLFSLLGLAATLAIATEDDVRQAGVSALATIAVMVLFVLSVGVAAA